MVTAGGGVVGRDTHAGKDSDDGWHKLTQTHVGGRTAWRACHASAMIPPRDPARNASYTERIAFVVELAQHLHAYGTTAQRLEGAIESVGKRLGLECEPWVNPTGMILAFSDPAQPAGASDTTRVLRVGLGDNDLYKLCEADRIAEDVMSGRLQIADGLEALRALDRPVGARARAMQILASAWPPRQWPGCCACRGSTSLPPA